MHYGEQIVAINGVAAFKQAISIMTHSGRSPDEFFEFFVYPTYDQGIPIREMGKYAHGWGNYGEYPK